MSYNNVDLTEELTDGLEEMRLILGINSRVSVIRYAVRYLLTAKFTQVDVAIICPDCVDGKHKCVPGVTLQIVGDPTNKSRGIHQERMLRFICGCGECAAREGVVRAS